MGHFTHSLVIKYENSDIKYPNLLNLFNTYVKSSKNLIIVCSQTLFKKTHKKRDFFLKKQKINIL